MNREISVKTQYRLIVGGLLGVLLIAGMLRWMACNGSSTVTNNGSGATKMYLTDSPAQYDAVVVDVIRVEVLMAGSDSTNGWTAVRSDSANYDLLVLRNGARAVLDSAGLVAGHYTQIRLVLGTGSYVVVAGVKYFLTIPSGMESGVKLNCDFDIVAGQTYELLLDFDAGQSIHVTGNGKYMMNPVIRCAAIAASGSIAGVIVPASANTWVWTIMGADTVETIADNTTGDFVLQGLIAGTYSIQCVPGVTTYRDTTLTEIAVVNQQQTIVGTVLLRQ